MSHTTQVAVKAGRRRGGFSMIELVIVVVIIGIIAAIAIPRMSRGAAAANDSALAQNLAILRNAMDLYQTEHGGFPAAAATVEAQLTLNSDVAGATNAGKTVTHIYGPYLRKVPPVTVGPLKGKAGANKIGEVNDATAGWWYYPASGDFKPNVSATEKDGADKLYSEY